MGLVDLHFHDSTFEFAPRVGREIEEAESTAESPATAATEPATSDREGTGPRSLSSSTAARGVGAVIALAVLVGIGVLVRKVGGGEEDGAGDRTSGETDAIDVEDV